jgi:ribosomal protein S18 acetylase RimI-like enzyme
MAAETGIRVEHMRSGDEEKIFAAEQIFDHPLDRAALSRHLADEASHLLIAYVGDCPAGMARAMELLRVDRAEKQMFLYEIGTDEEFQRRGVARALIEELKRFSVERGCFEMFVNTGETNTPAMRLYETTGGVRESTDDVMFIYTFD